MCSQFQVRLPLHVVEQAFSHTRFPLRFPQGRPNLEPRDQVTIGDTALVVVRNQGASELISLPFSWKGPAGRPVFNFRSEGRDFSQSRRCLVPVSGFFEFTGPQPGQKRKTRWLFSLKGDSWFWLAGLIKDGGFALLTTAPGPDIAPYHDRQVIVLPSGRGSEWLDLDRPDAEVLKPLEPGSLLVEQEFPPVAPTLL